jgi:HlyD family secretion protein
VAAALHKADAELLNARATVAQRDAMLEQARVELDRSVIRSPITGVVIGRDIDRGQTVAASLEAPTLFKIARDLRDMEVHAKIDEADIGRIRVSQPATFRVDAFPGRQFSGKVTQIRKAPEVVRNVVTYRVVIATRNPELLLLPGMTALVEIVVRETDEVLKLPNAALRFRPRERESLRQAAKNVVLEDAIGAERDVWALDDDGEPKPVRVRLGLSDASVTEVVEGPLREGQDVIVGTAPEEGERRLFGIRWGF